MTTYKAATGFNNAAGLADLSPQPACPGLDSGVIETGGDGLDYEDGVLPTTFDYGFLTYSDYSSLLSQLGGLSDSVKSARITVRLKRNSDRTFANYNAIVIRPDPKNDGGKYVNVRFVLRVFPTPL